MSRQMATQGQASPLHVVVALDDTTRLQQLQISSQQLPDPPTHFHVAYPADTAAVTLRALQMVGRIVHAVLLSSEELLHSNTLQLAGIIQEAPHAMVVLVGQPPPSAISVTSLPSHTIDYLMDPADKTAVHNMLLRVQAKKATNSTSCSAGLHSTQPTSSRNGLSNQGPAALQPTAMGSRPVASASGTSVEPAGAPPSPSRSPPSSHPVALPHALVPAPTPSSLVQRCASGADSCTSSAAGSSRSAAVTTQAEPAIGFLFPTAHPLSKVNRDTSAAYNTEISPLEDASKGVMLLTAQDAAVAKLRMALQRPSYSFSGTQSPTVSFSGTQQQQPQQQETSNSGSTISTSLQSAPYKTSLSGQGTGPATSLPGEAAKLTAAQTRSAQLSTITATSTSTTAGSQLLSQAAEGSSATVASSFKVQPQALSAFALATTPSGANNNYALSPAVTAQPLSIAQQGTAHIATAPSATAVTASALLQQVQQLRAQLDSKQLQQRSAPGALSTSTPGFGTSPASLPPPLSNQLSGGGAKQPTSMPTGLLQPTGSLMSRSGSGGGYAVGWGNLLTHSAGGSGMPWPQQPPNSPSTHNAAHWHSFQGLQPQQALSAMTSMSPTTLQQLASTAPATQQRPSAAAAPGSPGPLQTPFGMRPAHAASTGGVTWADSVTVDQLARVSAPGAMHTSAGHPSLEELARRSMSTSPARERLYSRVWATSGGSASDQDGMPNSPTAAITEAGLADDTGAAGTTTIAHSNSFVSAGSSRYNPLRKSGKLSLDDDVRQAVAAAGRSSNEAGTGLAGGPLAASSSLYLSAPSQVPAAAPIPAPTHLLSEIQPAPLDTGSAQPSQAAMLRPGASSSGVGAGNTSGSPARPSRLQRVTVGSSFDAATTNPWDPTTQLLAEPHSCKGGMYQLGSVTATAAQTQLYARPLAGMDEGEELVSIRAKAGSAVHANTSTSLISTGPGTAATGSSTASSLHSTTTSHPAALGAMQGFKPVTEIRGSKPQLSAHSLAGPTSALSSVLDDADHPELGSPREQACASATRAVAASWMQGVRDSVVLRGIVGMGMSTSGSPAGSVSQMAGSEPSTPQTRRPAGALTVGTSSPAGSGTPYAKRAARQQLGSHPIHIQYQDWL